MHNQTIIYTLCIDISINMLNVQFNFLQKSPTIAQTRGSILQKLGNFSISQSRDRIHDILCNEKLPFLKNVKIE